MPLATVEGTPPGTLFRHPHGERRRPARAHAVEPMLGLHARTDRSRDTWVAEPRLTAPEGGRLGEGQRLTPDAPRSGGRPPPPGAASHHPRGTQLPPGMQAERTVSGPHIRTPAPTACGWWTPTARPEGGRPGEGQRLAPDAPHNSGGPPPRGRPPPPPQSAAPPGHASRGDSAGPPHPHTRAHGKSDYGPTARPEGGQSGEGERLTADAPHSGPWTRTPVPTAAPEHRRQNPYHTHPERRGAQSFPQPVPPALSPGQGPEALKQGPPLDTATTVQQRGSDGADGAEPDCTNCRAVALTAACRHPARDTMGLRQYSPADSTALASAVAAFTMGPVAAWPAQLLPYVPCRDTQPRQPAATHAPTARLTAEQLYIVAAALLADGRESFVHQHGPPQIAASIQGPQCDARHPWLATLRGRTCVWDAGGGTPPPGPHQEKALVLQMAGYQGILHGHAGGYRSHVLAGGRWTVWHSTARQGAFPPLPRGDWQQGPTQAYYMSADLWPLAVLLHTVSALNKRQELGWVNLRTLVWSPDQEGHLRAAWQGDTIRATDVPDRHAGPITHARPTATLAVAQRERQNPQWVVCMLSLADAHIVVCDPERLPGPEAVVRVADCTRMIVKALREGEYHTLLLQVRLKDNARAARPGVWPAAEHPADLEPELAVPTTVHHWLQAFHDLQWRGKPDRQIGATHWQAWLQADAQRDAIRSLGPAPATRAPADVAPGRALAPHTVPLASLPFEPATEGAIRKSVLLPPARGGTEPTKYPLCADKYYTSGAMLEHLAWHAVHAAAPVDDKEAASNILQGRARRSPGTPRTPGAPRPRRPTTQTAMRRHPERPRGPAVRSNKGPSPRGWPP